MADTKEAKVLFCFCESTYQDEAYGPKKRLHNKAKDDVGYRCTVCDRTRKASDE